MAGQDEFTFVIYGLDKDNGFVRADVFARKVGLLVRALRAADKCANGGKRFDYVIEGLEKSSALTTVREKPATRRRIANSSVRTLGGAFSSVYEGAPISSAAKPLLSYVGGLAEGAEESFSHGEVRYSVDNVVRLDRFFVRQSAEALRAQTEAARPDEDADLFSGVAVTSFDGLLELLDARGTLLRGRLTLSAGGAEIDCVIRQDLLSDALLKFKSRVRVGGYGIYDGADYLPKRFNVETIEQIDASGHILNWKGKFKSLAREDSVAWVDEQD